MKIKVVLFVFAVIAICGTNVLAQQGPPKQWQHPGPKQSQHLTFSEKWNITASICRPTMQEIKQIKPDRPISCAGVYSGMGDKDDSPMFLYIEPGNIFDTSDDSEALRHHLLFVLGKYMKNDPEVSLLIFGSNNRMYLIDAQEFIYEYDRVLHGDDNLKGAWSNLERRTSKYGLSEVGDGCSKDAVGIDLRAFLPELGGGKMGIIEFHHCATQIKEASLHNEPSGYDPRPAPDVPRAQTPTTFRGHTFGENWQTFIRTEGGLCKIKVNMEGCAHAAAGADAKLIQSDKPDKNGQSRGGIIFIFNQGHLESVLTTMSGPTFADLSFLEKTYGTPRIKSSHPETGEASSYWRIIDDCLDVLAKETINDSGGFDILISIEHYCQVDTTANR